MKRPEIKRILVPTDFSATAQSALEQGAYMANLFKADLYLLHVVETMELIYTAYDPAVVLAIDTEEIERNSKKSLESEVEKIKKLYDIQVIPLMSKGKVVDEINDAALTNKADVIVMGTHGAKGFEEFFIGSNAHKIINLSPCPIITFQSFLKKPGFKNIVLPIDSSLHSRQKVDHAIEMASHFGATIKILGLVRTNEELDEKKFLIKIEAVEKALNKANINHDCKIVHGKNLAVETMQYSEEVKADLIMIMTDHESHLTGMFLGAFAKQIVNHSKIPVMSIKPIEGHYEPLDLSASSNPFVYY